MFSLKCSKGKFSQNTTNILSIKVAVCVHDIHYVLHGANGVPILQKMLCKFGLIIPIVVITEVFMKPSMERSSRLCDILLTTGWTT